MRIVSNAPVRQFCHGPQLVAPAVSLPRASCSRAAVRSPACSSSRHQQQPAFRTFQSSARSRRQQPAVVCSATSTGKLISSTEVPAFIQRDDMADQLYRWALIEAAEGGYRNFGMPMTVDPIYVEDVLWGFKIGILKDGVKQTDLAMQFDSNSISKHEWVGRKEDGFPVMEGKAQDIKGKNIEIWKLDNNPVSEDLRSTIRALCVAFASATNRYYAFGSVFSSEGRE